MSRRLRTLSVFTLILTLLSILLPTADSYSLSSLYAHSTAEGTPNESAEQSPGKSYIKWIDFAVTSGALRDTLAADLRAHEAGQSHSWIDMLAYLASRNGGSFAKYRTADLERLLVLLEDGSSIASHVKNEKLYQYYLEAYGAVLGGMVGHYTEVVRAEDGSTTSEEKYGLRVFSPIARGYSFSHFDDFGASRSYGYRRSHLGHDLMGSVGTPIIAVESGYVEAAGWNQYGGWRIGIRSFDGKRYYYYAHLRKNHPYNDIYEGKIVNAGEVIGYLGMTGYSAKENTNNIDTPHLHYGLQIIFDPVQKDGTNQIWIDLYGLTEFLGQNRSAVKLNAEQTEREALRWYEYPETPD